MLLLVVSSLTFFAPKTHKTPRERAVLDSVLCMIATVGRLQQARACLGKTSKRVTLGNIATNTHLLWVSDDLAAPVGSALRFQPRGGGTMYRGQPIHESEIGEKADGKGS